MAPLPPDLTHEIACMYECMRAFAETHVLQHRVRKQVHMSCTCVWMCSSKYGIYVHTPMMHGVAGLHTRLMGEKAVSASGRDGPMGGARPFDWHPLAAAGIPLWRERRVKVGVLTNDVSLWSIHGLAAEAFGGLGAKGGGDHDPRVSYEFFVWSDAFPGGESGVAMGGAERGRNVVVLGGGQSGTVGGCWWAAGRESVWRAWRER